MEQPPINMRPRRRWFPGGGLTLGTAFGVVLGVAINNFPVGLATGIGIGLLLEGANARFNRP